MRSKDAGWTSTDRLFDGGSSARFHALTDVEGNIYVAGSREAPCDLRVVRLPKLRRASALRLLADSIALGAPPLTDVGGIEIDGHSSRIHLAAVPALDELRVAKDQRSLDLSSLTEVGDLEIVGRFELPRLTRVRRNAVI